MSARVVKAQRRQMRRAVGDAGLTALRAHEQALNAHAYSLQRHEDLHETQRQAREALARALERRLDALDAITSRDFWGRLHWLLFGR